MTSVDRAAAPVYSFQGVAQIVRFNWPFYAIGALSVLAAALLASSAPLDGAAGLLLAAAVALAATWLVGSLVVSWLVYDRSALMTAEWIPRSLRVPSTRWLHVHAGLDSMTRPLRRVLGGAPGRVFDIFDERMMTEPSIRRARTHASSDASERVDYRNLPIEPGSVDLIVLPMSAHELRTHTARLALFTGVATALTADGRTIVVEHLRDWANFAAFGPGAFHFHSRGAWLRCFSEAGLTVHREFSITPFVHGFVLGKTA